MRAGALRHRLTIQVVSETDGTLGKGQTVSYTDVTTVWGEVRPLQAKEMVRGGANDAALSHEVRIRYYPGLGARHRFKFVKGGVTRYFNIMHPRNIAERDRELLIAVTEDV